MLTITDRFTFRREAKHEGTVWASLRRQKRVTLQFDEFMRRKGANRGIDKAAHFRSARRRDIELIIEGRF